MLQTTKATWLGGYTDYVLILVFILLVASIKENVCGKLTARIKLVNL